MKENVPLSINNTESNEFESKKDTTSSIEWDLSITDTLNCEPIKPDDKLFKGKTGLTKDYASINRNKDLNNDLNFMLIIEGYKNSSLQLIDGLIKSDKTDWFELDTKIYPILFLFRQYLELIIKQTIRLNKLVENKIESDEVGFKAIHSLAELWNEVRPIIESQYDQYENKDELVKNDDWVARLMLELNDYDNGSFAFRYPYKNPKFTKGKVEDNLNSFTIDIKNLKAIMEKLIVYFEGNNELFRVLLEKKQTV